MITGIQSGMQMSGYSTQSTQMTEQQNAQLKNILAEYDSTSLSDDDAKELVATIKEMGINPSEELATVLADSGIDAQALAEQAGIGGAGGLPGGGGGPGGPGGGGHGGGGPRGVESLDEAVVSLITEALEAYDESDETQSFAELLAEKLDEQGYDSSKPAIDYYA